MPRFHLSLECPRDVHYVRRWREKMDYLEMVKRGRHPWRPQIGTTWPPCLPPGVTRQACHCVVLKVFGPVMRENDIWLVFANTLDAQPVGLAILLHGVIWVVEAREAGDAEHGMCTSSLGSDPLHGVVFVGDVGEVFIAVSETYHIHLATSLDDFADDATHGEDAVVKVSPEN